ncbi:hypothetical protein AB0I60_27300 [Actinosynnema sp. NPDC050436]|uniref:hypothetical protein n=1 Tax=Actinosynnema sp. NPDC050436 TaxID=3155659 RepID=UPI0033D6D0DF
MRIVAVMGALLLLVGCSGADADTPDLRDRIVKSFLGDDAVKAAGFAPDGSPPADDQSPLLPCPTELSTDDERSRTRLTRTWSTPVIDVTKLVQRTLGYPDAEVAAATVQDARRALDCGKFQVDGQEHEVSGEMNLKYVQADAKFGFCHRAKRKTAFDTTCHLLLARGPLVTVVTITNSVSNLSNTFDRLGNEAYKLLPVA